MNPDLQRRVQRYGWDRAEADYERGWAAQLWPAQRRVLEMARLAPGESVLDAACGTGLVTLRAARMVGEQGRVAAVDLSERMVQRTKVEAGRLGLDRIEVARMDAEQLEYPDASFDVSLCALGLMYLPDPLRGVRELGRVTRPGGRVVAAVWGARAACGWAEIFPIVDARVHSEVCPLFFQLGTGDTLAETFREAGLVELRARRVTTSLRYTSPDAALRAAFAGGPVAMAYSRFDPGVREDAHRAYLLSIEPFRRGSCYDIPGEFVIVAGRVPGRARA
jgi:ubiquinone/menaquinone biosynthesis C-methylase UbiE